MSVPNSGHWRLAVTAVPAVPLHSTVQMYRTAYHSTVQMYMTGDSSTVQMYITPDCTKVQMYRTSCTDLQFTELIITVQYRCTEPVISHQPQILG